MNLGLEKRGGKGERRGEDQELPCIAQHCTAPPSSPSEHNSKQVAHFQRIKNRGRRNKKATAVQGEERGREERLEWNGERTLSTRDKNSPHWCGGLFVPVSGGPGKERTR